MRPISTYVAAAALAIGGIAFVGCDKDNSASNTNTTPGGTTADNRTTGEKVGDGVKNAADKTADAAKRAGSEVSDAAQTAGGKIKDSVGGLTGGNGARIPGMLGDVTEAALTKEGLNDVVERFVDADRNRIGKTDLDSGNDALNALIASISADWKAKYNTDFDIHDANKVFAAPFATVAAGELGKNAGGAEVKLDTDRKIDGTTETKIDVDRKSGVDKPTSPTADTNLNDPGRNVAVVQIAASHGLPALSVPLIHEAGGWKIDVPDTLDAARLRNNLQAQLNDVYSMKAQWPATADEAYRAVGHHVLLAVMDRPAK